MNILLSSAIAYLLGSIPFALVVGKVFYKTDVRNFGSGNLGGTNAGRVLGKKAGITVILFDVFKAALAMVIARAIDPSTMIYAGFFATIGHCFPIFAGFKGGKAVSTAVGFLLALSILITQQPLIDFVVPIVIFLVILYLFKMVSLASIIAMPAAAIILWLTQSNWHVSLAFSIVAAIVVWRHRANIQRIIKGEESKISWL